MKRIISAAVVLGVLLTGSAQAQSTDVPDSGYPTDDTEIVTYTDGSAEADPYENQIVTETDLDAADPSQVASPVEETDVNNGESADSLQVTPSPLPMSSLSSSADASSVSDQQPDVTPSPLPLSSLAASASATAAPIIGSEGGLSDLAIGQNEDDIGAPLYESTRQYMEKLRSSGFSCTYRGEQGPSSESVFASFSGNSVTLNTIAVFSDTETDCILYVLRFVDFKGKNPDLVSPLLDALNADYRFAKFYSAPNESVSVTLDLLFSEDNAGEICYDGLRRLLSICDECYEALSSSIEALPDEGEEIIEWDGSVVDENGPVPTAPVPTAPVPTAPVPTAPVPTAPVPTAPVPTAPVPTAPDVPFSTPFPQSVSGSTQNAQDGQNNSIMKGCT